MIFLALLAAVVEPPPSPGDDAALVARLKAKDAKAFRGLVSSLHGKLKRLALSYVRSEAVAEEVVQETWVAVISGLETFEGRSSLKGWIFRILVNRAQTRGVREARSVPVSALGAAGDGDGGDSDADRFDEVGHWKEFPDDWPARSADALIERKEAIAALTPALERLPEKQRAVFLMRDVEGLSSHEVCNVLGLEETHQRVLLHRARSRLREAVEAAFSGKKAEKKS